MSSRKDITVYLWNGNNYDRHGLRFNKGDPAGYARCEARFLALLPDLGLSDTTATRYHHWFNGVSTALFNGYYGHNESKRASLRLKPGTRTILEPRI